MSLGGKATVHVGRLDRLRILTPGGGGFGEPGGDAPADAGAQAPALAVVEEKGSVAAYRAAQETV